MKKFIFSLLAFFLILSCNSNNSDRDFLNTTWTLKSFKKTNGEIIPIKEDEIYTVQFFEDNYLSGRKDCNRYLGQYVLGSNNALTIDSLTTTQMHCTMEYTYAGAIDHAAFYHVSGNRLKLYSADYFTVLDYIAEINITNTVWKLESFQSKGSKIIPVNPNERYTILLSDDLKLKGHADCNSYWGTYKFGANNTIKIDSLINTLVHCGDESMFSTYMEAIHGALFYKLEAENLKIFYKDSSSILNYVAETNLINTVWNLQSFETRHGEIILVEPDEKYTINFHDGTKSELKVSGKKDCNLFNGDYESGSQNSLSIDNLKSTLMFCTKFTMEKAYYQAIDKAASYQISGNKLTIFTSDSLAVLNYVGK